MFILLYSHTDDGVFDSDFPKISDHFPKIYEIKAVAEVTNKAN